MSEPFFKLQRAKEYKGRVKKLKRNAEKHVEKKMGGSLTTPTLSCHTHGSTCIPQRKPPLSTPWVICCPQRSLYIIPSQVLSGSPIWSIRCSRSCGMSLLRQGFKGTQWLLPLSWIACLRAVSCHVERPAWQETKAPPPKSYGVPSWNWVLQAWPSLQMTAAWLRTEVGPQTSREPEPEPPGWVLLTQKWCEVNICCFKSLNYG